MEPIPLYVFGTGSAANESSWRELLTGTGREELTQTRAVLGRFLDVVAGGSKPDLATLEAITTEWLANRESASVFDWRYHFVKYPRMREGKSGIYVADGTFGYSLCMLHRFQMNSHYRDPYLVAVWERSGVGDRAQDPWFTGYENTARWLRLTKSDCGLRSVPRGFEVTLPFVQGPEGHAALAEVCARHGAIRAGEVWFVEVAQDDQYGELVDTLDRVLVGAALVHDLVAVGL